MINVKFSLSFTPMPTVNNVRQFGPELLTLTRISLKHLIPTGNTSCLVWWFKTRLCVLLYSTSEHRPKSYYDVSEKIKAYHAVLSVHCSLVVTC